MTARLPPNEISKSGVKPSADRILADELGFRLKTVQRIGGAGRLIQMSPEARALMESIAKNKMKKTTS